MFFQPKVHVNYDFAPKNRESDELEIRRGEVITVLDASDPDWWEGQVERDNIIYKGYFPFNYVTQIWAADLQLYCPRCAYFNLLVDLPDKMPGMTPLILKNFTVELKKILGRNWAWGNLRKNAISKNLKKNVNCKKVQWYIRCSAHNSALPDPLNVHQVWPRAQNF